jgi:outer membrane immunogenic protein
LFQSKFCVFGEEFKMKKFALAISALVVSAVGASAADMAVKARPMAVDIAYSFTGWYIGANAGYAWSNNSLNSTATAGPCDPAAGGGCALTPTYSTLSAIGSTFSVPLKTNGFIGGGQFGYNWQSANFVAGLEADIQGLSDANKSVTFASTVPSTTFPAQPLTQTTTVSRSLDYLGTVRGRVGFLAAPSFLIYGTGGLAYGGVNTSTSITQGCIGCTFFGGNPNTTGSLSSTRVGYAVGAGLEWMFAQNWSAKAEYLYYDLGTANNTLPQLRGFNGGGAVAGPLFMSSTAVTSTRFSGDVVRAGINYHFGGPVVARY